MTHLRYESQTRTETDQSVIDNLVRKGWEIFTPEPVVEVPPLLTAEQAVAQYFSPYQTLALQRLEMALMQAGKPLGPKMTAAKTWLETVMLSWAASPTPAPAEAFGVPQASFAEASGEAVASLNS
jgi:hypothetical protein